MTRKVYRHTLNNTVGLKTKQTLRARHHLRAHPVRALPQQISVPSSSQNIIEQIYKQIKVEEPRLSSRRPGNDFYTYVNGDWMNHTRIPSYVSSYGVSEEVETILQGVLYTQIQSCMQLAEVGREQTTPDGIACDAIGRLAMSAMRPQVQKNNIEYLKRGIHSMGCMREPADISRAIGSMTRYNVRTVLDLSVIPGEGGRYVMSIGSGELGLPTTSYYVSPSSPSKSDSILQGYTRLIRRACEALEIDDLSSAVAFEGSIAPSIYAIENARNDSNLSLQNLQSKWPAFHWKDMFLSYGVPEEQMTTLRIYVDSHEWLDTLAKHLVDTPLETWYTVFSLHTLLHALPYLPPPFDTLNFDLFGKQMRGQKEKIPQKFLMLNIVKQQMSTALGRLFVKHTMPASLKATATQFTKKIVASAIRRMEAVDWLSPSARKAAAEKLRRMKLSIAWSSPLVASPPQLPSLQTDTLLANVYLLEASTTDRKLKWLQSPPKVDEWEEPPYSVNAYYYHDTNELIVPAGSFMWPFMDSHPIKGLGWSYGGLGAVIGHEITHAFDREGKEFDPSGRAAPWWSATVLKAYQARTKALVRLFSDAKLLGRQVNGAITLDENLADLGGLAIALDALHHALQGASEDEKRAQMRHFFLAYAVSWRTKEHPERQLQRLLLDKHAPVELRVNLIVSQFEEWYTAFDIQTGDALYVPPEERIRIF
jgi:putative endopeptidase